ncbi:MAG: DNA polymerase [Planctomycetota bacterium]|nr:DNA polymerase [Planctomycetota bacterium]
MSAAARSDLRWLFVDMNAYFASAEQEARPELQGRPVAVAALMVETTCCIAVSYEAKACGVKTGMLVGQARRLCPSLIVVEARPTYYVRLHHKIVKAIETVLPIDAVKSIDEMACRLTAWQQEPSTALALAKEVKQAIRSHAGKTLCCSVGLAPNRFLAKVASDMRKPDGLTMIRRSDLPNRLHALQLNDLPGIGPQMLRRLNQRGITSVTQLCRLSKEDLRDIWSGIVGVRWWHWLRGDDLPEPPTRRATVGHSHVLPPELRNDAGARSVAVRLLHRAAARMRRLEYYTGSFSVAVFNIGADRGWEGTAKLGHCRDTSTLLAVLGELWSHRPQDGIPLRVAVTLFDLAAASSVPRSLFEEDRQRDRLSKIVDQVNERFGSTRLYFAPMFEAHDTAPVRIAFTQVPDEADVSMAEMAMR